MCFFSSFLIFLYCFLIYILIFLYLSGRYDCNFALFASLLLPRFFITFYESILSGVLMHKEIELLLASNRPIHEIVFYILEHASFSDMIPLDSADRSKLNSILYHWEQMTRSRS